MPAKLDVPIGTRFGRLVVTGELDMYLSPGGHSIRQFALVCDCGNRTTALLSNLRKPLHTTSCGCLHKETVAEMGKANVTHGLSYEPLYAVYNQMVARCNNPNNEAYHNYGGRGISVCDEWLGDMSAFMDWATANGYVHGLTIERRNNDGNYEPSNCDWVERVYQARNKRSNVTNLDIARAIREDDRSNTDIAHEYNMSRTNVSDIKNNRIWKE